MDGDQSSEARSNGASDGTGRHGSQRRPELGAPLDLRTAHLWHLQPVRDILVIAIVIATIYLGYAIRTVTVPLLIALALAYLVEPVVSRVSRWRRMNRPLAVGAILTALGGSLALVLVLVIPLAVGQTLSFAENLRNHRYDGAISRAIDVIPEQYRADVRTWVDRVVKPGAAPDAAAPTRDGAPSAGAPAGASADRDPAPSSAPQVEPPVTARADAPAEAVAATPATGPPSAEPDWTGSLSGTWFSLLGSGSRQVYGFVLGLLQLGLVAFLIPFYFYYFSVYWPSITGFFAKLVPDERRGSFFSIVQEMDRAVAGFVRGRIVICILMGVMFAIGWQICGVPYGVALGLLTGAFSIVPYLGGIGAPIAVLLLAADQFGLPADARMPIWGMLLWPTLVFVVVQTIEGYVLTPIIAGKATNLDPVTIVVAILAGGSVAGIYGMLLAIPLAACGKIAIKRIVLPRLIEFARGRVADPLPIEGALDDDGDGAPDSKENRKT